MTIQESIVSGDHSLATIGLLGMLNECHVLREHRDSQMFGGLQPAVERVDRVLAAVCAKYQIECPSEEELHGGTPPDRKRHTGFGAAARGLRPPKPAAVG